MGETTATTTTPLTVHRCRFIDYAPSAVTAIAFTPLPLPSPRAKRKPSSTTRTSRKVGTLAVGHANGNIGIWDWAGDDKSSQCSQAWVVKKTLYGPYPSKVDSIAFVIRHPDDYEDGDVPKCSDLRLFSSGGGSELLEWDMGKGCIQRSLGSQGGSIWCMAVNPASTMLALGCEDGTIRLLSVINDTLTHIRRFDRIKGRILSVTWGPPRPKMRAEIAARADDSDSDEDKEEEWTDSWLVTGGSDSSIRKWDVATGRAIDRMGTDKIRGERTLVWAIGVLGNGTIVSGDSLGMIKFWDSRTCTQLQSFQSHGADVLCLTIGTDGTTVYTSGVDQKTTQFALVSAGGTQSLGRWVQSSSRRMHSHDVRAIAAWPPYTPLPPSHNRAQLKDSAPILASGGLDMSVVVTPAALPSATTKIINPLATSTDSTFEESYYRRLAYDVGAGSTSVIKAARKARLVSCIRGAGLTIWKILSKSTLSEDMLNLELMGSSKEGWERVLEMDLSVQTNLVASAISDDGRWVAVSDLYETKLFSLIEMPDGQLTPHRIRSFSATLRSQFPESASPSTGSSGLMFTPDSSKLILCTTLSPYILVIELMGDRPSVLRRFDHHRLRGSLAGDRVIKNKPTDGDVQTSDQKDELDPNQVLSGVTIQRIAISPDGQWLATVDDSCRTHVFNLDSLQHHAALPSFSKPAQVLTFSPKAPSTLIMAFPDNTIQIFNVETRQFPSWGKDFSARLPKRFSHAHDPILGIMFDPSTITTEDSQPALFWGSTWLCKLNFKDSSGAESKKRRRGSMKDGDLAATISAADHGPGGGHRMVTHYRPILYADFLGPGEILIVERPLVDVLSILPPAYFKHKYGAS